MMANERDSRVTVVHEVIYYILTRQLGTTAYIALVVALIYVIGGLQNNVRPLFIVNVFLVTRLHAFLRAA